MKNSTKVAAVMVVMAKGLLPLSAYAVDDKQLQREITKYVLRPCLEKSIANDPDLQHSNPEIVESTKSINKSMLEMAEGLQAPQQMVDSMAPSLKGKNLEERKAVYNELSDACVYYNAM